jgi:dTMP kinase
VSAGAFVVLEGGEACGKSTQVPLLAERLRARGLEVVTTFEPGATATGAVVRRLLLHGDEPVGPVAEALLMAADRAQHVAEVVRPAVERGAWVVSDRHLPSSLVYQGVVRGLGVEVVDAINRPAVAGLEPALVVVLDVTDEAARARHHGPDDRLEAEGVGFHAAVRAAYRRLAVPRRWHVVEAGGTVEDVAARVWALVEPLVGSR